MSDSVKISGDINMTFDRMAREFPEIESDALKVGAFYLKEKVKDTFTTKMPAATRPVRVQTGRNGYPITSQEPLVEAVRQSKTKNGSVKVHALGAKAPNSSTFIARFYEGVTKPRYQKNYRGKKLKKKRYTGVVGGKNYFGTSINSYMDDTIGLIQEVINNKIDKINNGQ